MVKKTVKKKKKKANVRKTPAAKSTSSAEPEKIKVTPHPTAGPKVTDFEEKLDAQIAPGETGESKRPRGRPRKVVEPEPEASPEFIKGALKLPFELWSIGQGIDELALSDIEAKQLAEPVKQLLDYYLPKIPAITYAWCTCAVSIFWIMRPRMLKIQELKKQSPPPTKTKDGTESGTAREGPHPSSPAESIKFPGIIKPQKL